MDEAESDCSETYFSASESLLPVKERISLVSTKDSQKTLPEQSSNAHKLKGGETSTLREEGLPIGCTSLISRDSGNKTSSTRRRRVRHNSETTKVRDSFVINHALNGMNTLYVLWANDKLCDSIVTVDGKEFPAHSVVLATHSDYFLGLLLKEKTGASLPRRLSIDGLVSAPGFGRLLSYMYTSEIDLRWGNVCDTMQTANSLSVARVVELGREFLQSYNIESCLDALLVSKQANLVSLHANIRNFVLDNFMSVSRTKGFLKCPAETLARLMTDDNLNVNSELDILIAAKTWIRHNGQEGLKSAPLLIKQVRFHYIPSRDLKKYIEDDDQLMQIPEVKSKVMTVYKQRRTPLETTSDASERSQKRSKEKTTDDEVHKLLLTSAQFSRDRLHMMTSEEESAEQLSDQSAAKKIPNASQHSIEANSDDKTKALTVDKKVWSEPLQSEADTSHEANLVSQTPTSVEPPPKTSSASSSPSPQPQPVTPTKSTQLVSQTPTSVEPLIKTSSASSSPSPQPQPVFPTKSTQLVSQTPTSVKPPSKTSSASSSPSPQPQPVTPTKSTQPISQKPNSVEPPPKTSSASSSPLPQPQPVSPTKTTQPLAKTSPTLSTSTTVSDPVHIEVHISKGAKLTTQTTAALPPHEVTSPSDKHSLFTPDDVSESSQQPRVTTPQSPKPWPMPQTAHGANMALQSAKTPRKHFRNYFAPRLTSDYRITASNPKALASGPIAWPVTQHTERKHRPDVIITVGGVAKSGESEVMGRLVEAFLLDKNEWREMTQLPVARNHHVVHFLNGFVYVVGGSDPHADGDDFLKPVNSVLKYDVRSGQWSEAQPMNSARIFHEVTALFGQLYVVGGQDQAGRTLATVECYSPSTDRWRYVAALPSPRYGMAVTVYRGQIWVAGGFPEDRMAETSTVPRDVVCYNVFRDEWNLVTPLRVPRCHTSLLEMADRLYMIGGFVGDASDSEEKNQSLSTIDLYDERTDEWVFVADLWQGRHDANTVAVGDKAYIIGGMDDENEDPLPNVECFDPIAMSWAHGLAALPSARFGHACCVVPGDTRSKWEQS